jgi:hypothetical protein
MNNYKEEEVMKNEGDNIKDEASAEDAVDTVDIPLILFKIQQIEHEFTLF